MADPRSLRLEQSQKQSLKQAQRLMMLPQMQQALALLQLPVMELAAQMEIEMQQNPLLDDAEEEIEKEFIPEEERPDPPEIASDEQEVHVEATNFEVLRKLDEEFRDHLSQTESHSPRRDAEEDKRKTFLESLICDKESLGEHLMQQVQETFSSQDELAAAELLIGYLNDNGLLGTELHEIALLHDVPEALLEKVLHIMQTFEPIGVAATTLQEAMLIQLRFKGKENSRAYAIVADYWDDLLHHRIPAIARALHCSAEEVSAIIERDIAKLDLHPGGNYTADEPQTITPDVTLRQEGQALLVFVNDDPLPPFRVNYRYLRMLDDPTLAEETRDFIRQKLNSAKWLAHTVGQRQETLYRISDYLAKQQADFFLNADGKLKPLTMQTVADEIGVHESTVARAVANKYLNSPRGVLPLRSFFTNAYLNAEGQELSSKTVRDAIERLIQRENKSKPFSDNALSRLLKMQGIQCARRTIAKYRGELKIGNALQRRVY